MTKRGQSVTGLHAGVDETRPGSGVVAHVLKDTVAQAKALDYSSVADGHVGSTVAVDPVLGSGADLALVDEALDVYRHGHVRSLSILHLLRKVRRRQGSRCCRSRGREGSSLGPLMRLEGPGPWPNNAGTSRGDHGSSL